MCLLLSLLLLPIFSLYTVLKVIVHSLVKLLEIIVFLCLEEPLCSFLDLVFNLVPPLKDMVSEGNANDDECHEQVLLILLDLDLLFLHDEIVDCICLFPFIIHNADVLFDERLKVQLVTVSKFNFLRVVADECELVSNSLFH